MSPSEEAEHREDHTVVDSAALGGTAAGTAVARDPSEGARGKGAATQASADLGRGTPQHGEEAYPVCIEDLEGPTPKHRQTLQRHFAQLGKKERWCR